jgi:hypothetical protein
VHRPRQSWRDPHPFGGYVDPMPKDVVVHAGLDADTQGVESSLDRDREVAETECPAREHPATPLALPLV